MATTTGQSSKTSGGGYIESRITYTVSNNVATITSQLIDTILFTFIAFLGIYSLKTVSMLCITTYCIKVVLAFCETPFLYSAKKIKND